ncbi:hypothetical protein TNCT1_36270 [Streptomyces sp. 1-11]|nr:hypothetical protein TNCT1_36270 [Streptomyces sp. 1-11]
MAAFAVALLTLFVPAVSLAAPFDRLSQLQRDADALRDDGVTGVSVTLETPHGVRTVRSGVGDLSTGQPVAADGYVRIGSATKTFVAVVLLQLVGEGRLSLDDTVDAWLPGLVRGHGNDGRRVTLRQLLQHTSGLPDYIGDVVPDLSAVGYRANRWATYTSRQRVALAMQHAPSFAPGSGWEYSNTNYVLLGMVIQAVTGHSWEYEVRARILRPLRLTRTLTPGNWPFLPGPHARNYQQFEPGGAVTDTTIAYLPFDADADGSVISTNTDTNRFFTALVQGRLLAPTQLAEMQRTFEVPATAASHRARATGSACSGHHCPAAADTGGTAATDSATWYGLPRLRTAGPPSRSPCTADQETKAAPLGSTRTSRLSSITHCAPLAGRRRPYEQHPPPRLIDVAATNPRSTTTTGTT